MDKENEHQTDKVIGKVNEKSLITRLKCHEIDLGFLSPVKCQRVNRGP